MMVDVHLTVSLFPRPKVLAIVRDGPGTPSHLCDIESKAVRSHHEFRGAIGQRWHVQFVEDARRLQAVLDANITLLLDEHDRAVVAETVGDRAEAANPDIVGRRELGEVRRRIEEQS